MKLLILIFSVFFLSSCGGDNYWWSSSRSCTEPENPYSAGGHYEWFEWAESRWVTSCDGNSNSFNEWCEEYGRQLEIYNQCNQ